MANGFLCERCGWQETDHKEMGFVNEPGKCRDEYTISLIDCGCFTLGAEGRKAQEAFEEEEREEGRYWAEKERVYAEVMQKFAPDFLRWARLAAQMHPQRTVPETVYPPPDIFRSEAA